MPPIPASAPRRKTRTNPARPSRRRKANDRRRKGFTTILILGILLLMLLLVLAYLRTLRNYQASVDGDANGGRAREAMMDLAADIGVLIGADGKISPVNSTDTMVYEPYDYPWTCQRNNAPCFLSYPTSVTSQNGLGDPRVDDSWLSPIEPDANGNWPQVSNIRGSFLKYDDASLSNIPKNAATGEFVPVDAPAGRAVPNLAAGLFIPFQNLSKNDKRLVDVDGDGVRDSLWFYPKGSLKGNTRYVAAVRVIDLSGLLNLNTALGEWADTNTPRKGEGTYEVNASALGALMPSGPVQLGAMPAGSKTFRAGAWNALTSPVPSGRAPAQWNDWDYWCASGARTGDNAQPFNSATRNYGLADAFSLLDFTDKYADPTARIYTDYTTLKASHDSSQGYPGLRRYVTTMSGVMDRYAALPYALLSSNLVRDPNGSGFALGGNRTRPYDLFANQANLNQPAPPTSYPAITDAAGNSNTVSSQFTYGGWLDIANFWEAGTYGVTDFLQGINDPATTQTVDNSPLSPNGTEFPSAYPYPEGFKFLTRFTNASNRAFQYQIQMGSNTFQDALGRDNLTTVASEWNAWEPLPVMTEFYAQMPYVVMCPYVAPWNTNSAGTFPNTPVLVFPKMTLAQLTQADIRNLNALNYSVVDNIYFYNQTATDITAQFQGVRSDWGNNNECWKLQFQDSPAGVTVRALYAKAQPSASYPLGTDFDALAVGSAPWQSDFRLGLPIHTGSTGSNWSVLYANLTENRQGTGGSGAGVAAGEVILGGNNATSTDWRAPCSAGVGSYAIEFANPYPIPIRLTNVRFDFRRFDYYELDGNHGSWTNPAYASATLDTYVNAAPPAGMTQDAEGYYVLKPGDRIVFFRNGTENQGPGGVRTKTVGPGYKSGTIYAQSQLVTWKGLVYSAVGSGALGQPDTTPSDWTPYDCTDVSKLISGGSGSGTLYKVNLTPFNATLATSPATVAPFNVDAPDLNGYPSTWGVGCVEIQARGQWSSGGPATGNYTWLPCQRVTYPALPAGWDANNSYYGEFNVPDGYQGAPGQLAYKQVDIRSFGVDEKLNLLQARPPVHWQSQKVMQNDLGDYELRTNTFGQVGKGNLPLPDGVTLPYPDPTQTVSGWTPSANNTPSTMPLSPQFLYYNSSLTALGRATKVAFPGAATDYPAPGGRRAYATRQNIKNEPWVWNYMGLPSDSTYPGTFPEFASGANPNNTNPKLRDNPKAQGTGSGVGAERRDGFPRILDLLKVPLVGPLYLIHYPNVWWGGNWDFRGTPTVSETQTAGASPNSPLVGKWENNTLMDALHFYLTKDSEVNGGNAMGLRGLCLRTDIPWFDINNVATKYASLPYNAATSYAVGQEALFGGEVYRAQQAGTLAQPDPTPGTGNVGASLAWGYSNGPYARASQSWRTSWGEVLCSRWEVDSPKYKGNTGANSTEFKPGLINLNTAPKSVLKCLSLPNNPVTGVPVDANKVADAIIAARNTPAAGAASVSGGPVRQGLALPSEAFSGLFLADGTTANPDPKKSLKSYTADSALTSGAGTAKFYTNDPDLNLETTSWLPQQASCRSDVFAAYILVQGFNAKDFNLGPVDLCRAIAIYKRDTSGATVIPIIFTLPNQ